MTVTDDGSAVVHPPVGDARAREPSQLSTLIAERISRLPEGDRRRPLLQGILNAHASSQDRRAAVLAHGDLAARLARPPLCYRRPGDWNGYIPPVVALDDDGGILRRVEQNGRAVFNQLGRRSSGIVYNDTPERAALIEISTEAWHRRNNPPITQDNPEISQPTVP
jgi:hypothetical protein